MIRTGLRAKNMIQRIKYTYSFDRLKNIAKKYTEKKQGLDKVNSLGMTKKDTVSFIQEVESTFDIKIPDSDLIGANDIMSLDRIISKKIKSK